MPPTGAILVRHDAIAQTVDVHEDGFTALRVNYSSAEALPRLLDQLTTSRGYEFVLRGYAPDNLLEFTDIYLASRQP